MQIIYNKSCLLQKKFLLTMAVACPKFAGKNYEC